MYEPLHNLLTRIVKTGNLTVIWASGETVSYGDSSGMQVCVRVTDEEAERLLARDPELTLGEMYMQGRFVIDEGDIYDFFSLIRNNTLDSIFSSVMKFRRMWRILKAQVETRLPINKNRRNVSHHYDLTPALFDLFLDDDWQYSCGYFETENSTLDEAQLAKKRHLASKLRLSEKERVLEIGSGWGGLAIYLAETTGADITGITLSHEQLTVSSRRAEERNLSDRVRFELKDYRNMKAAPFDRIVSVGMFEHVGTGRYDNFFRKCYELLDEDGIMLLHSIGRTEPGYNMTNPFIAKYIFPGGYIPSLSEVLPAVERSGFLVRDIEILQMHYAYTLREWRKRFVARKEEAIALYDETFFRMWNFYLAGSEMAFAWDRMFIFQMQLTKKQLITPNIRNYMTETENALKKRESNLQPHARIKL
ncbi:cyclopropane-fatty-acyl-phospholipid synthase family protein [uncultured Cohaesibacter sp.]|uniref:cyclopropane-fatty-acyl-phospholipid synthase family protein n=1 Tax=uncultured Cohaesibacter sp. TaxID=1002546 RepID=UPI00293032E1|nr:cyclopropane-fatty-acyl-phospholipid synthase family protein [uncultured Cohaesibacter sp.]